MITRFLIALNVIAFGWELLTLGPGIFSGNVSLEGLAADGALVPVLVTQYHEWWRLISGAFLHGSLLHIGVNMFSLFVLGRFIEMAIGSPKMLAVYALALIGSSLGVAYFSDPNTVTVGASGAIYGLFGALFAIGLRLGKPGMALIRDNIGILAINLVFTFAVPGISKVAHLGGLLVGFLVTLPLYTPPRRILANVVDAQTGMPLESEYQPPNSIDRSA